MSPKIWNVLRYTLLIVLAGLFLLPFYVIIRNAFSTRKNIASPTWQWLPDQLNLANLESLLANDSIGIGRALINSAIMAAGQTTLTVIVSLMAGYALARYTHKLARFLLAATLFTLMVPATMTFVPMFIMLSVWCVGRIAYITIILHYIHEIQYIYWAYPITWTMSSVILLICLLKTDWVHGLERGEKKLKAR